MLPISGHVSKTRSHALSCCPPVSPDLVDSNGRNQLSPDSGNDSLSSANSAYRLRGSMQCHSRMCIGSKRPNIVGLIAMAQRRDERTGSPRRFRKSLRLSTPGRLPFAEQVASDRLFQRRHFTRIQIAVRRPRVCERQTAGDRNELLQRSHPGKQVEDCM